MKQFLLNLITAGSSTSSTRFVALTVVINVMIIWSIVCIKKMIVWAAICMQKGLIIETDEIPDIPWGVVALIGVVLTGKVIQKKFENGNGNNVASRDAKPEEQKQ